MAASGIEDQPRVLVIGTESGRMRRLGDLAIQDLLEGVGSLARLRVRHVHEMHGVCRDGGMR